MSNVEPAPLDSSCRNLSTDDAKNKKQKTLKLFTIGSHASIDHEIAKIDKVLPYLVRTEIFSPRRRHIETLKLSPTESHEFTSDHEEGENSKNFAREIGADGAFLQIVQISDMSHRNRNRNRKTKAVRNMQAHSQIDHDV